MSLVDQRTHCRFRAADGDRGHAKVNGAFARRVSALGIALALEEIDAETAEHALIEQDRTVWSPLLVLGMSEAWSGPLIVDHALKRDPIDTEPVRAALDRLKIGQGTTRLARSLQRPRPRSVGRSGARVIPC